MNVSILNKDKIQEVLELKNVIPVIENAYKLKAQKETVVWPLVSYDFVSENAVMDIRSGYVISEKIHGLKMLNNFPNNIEKRLPSFNGILIIFDSETGCPLGILDAAYVTCMRTGAAGAIGAKFLAREDADKLLILGAGKQAIYQLAATLILLPNIKKVRISDPLNYENAVNFVSTVKSKLQKEFKVELNKDIIFEAVKDLKEGVLDSDIIITITPSRSPVIKNEWIKNGTHLSCIGADMEGKQEIDSEIFRRARIYADDKAQCMKVGEMELPITQGVISEKDIIGEIGEVLIGKIDGRTSKEDITIFDATGLAPLDLLTGKLAIDLVKEQGLDLNVDI